MDADIGAYLASLRRAPASRRVEVDEGDRATSGEARGLALLAADQ